MKSPLFHHRILIYGLALYFGFSIFLSLPQTKADNTPAPNKRRASAVVTSTQALLKQTREQLQAAEARARNAEAVAAAAREESRAAQEAAAQALEAARQSQALLEELKRTFVEMKTAQQRSQEALYSLTQDEKQLSVAVNGLSANAMDASKKIDALNKKTEGVVTTAAKFPLKFTGNILLNASFGDRGSNNIDIPLFAARTTDADVTNHQNFSMTARQSRFGGRLETKIFSDALLTGVFEFDLLGGKPPFTNGAHFDLLRLRLAYARIDWKKSSLLAGQDWTVFSPLNPTTLATIAIPGLVASGNLWQRLPQLRYERRETVGEKGKILFQFALLDPNAGDQSNFVTLRPIGAGERGSMPAYESRVVFSAPWSGQQIAFGFGGHYARLIQPEVTGTSPVIRATIDSYAVGGDWQIPFPHGKFSGEAFRGRALGIFSGGIFQSTTLVNRVRPLTVGGTSTLVGEVRGINSSGGWAELHFDFGPKNKWSSNFSYGIEAPRASDVAEGARVKNQTYLGNVMYKFHPNFTLAIEYRQILTDWRGSPSFRRATNNKLNFGNLALLYTF